MKKALSLVLTVLMLVGVLSVFTVLPVSAADWNGTTATAPKGEGTKENPYLIENAENLLWVQQQVPAADRTTDPAAPAFKDMYLEQTADIDLNGKSIKSIGFYYSNPERMGAFGGNYNGNGFKIFNGTIASYNSGHDVNNNWGHGLFGIIYGATIKNVNLEDATVIGHGLTGAIVGRAVSTEDGKITNTIENCNVKNVTVDVNFPVKKATPQDYYGRARAGGICGWASGTEFLYCSTNNVKLLVPVNFLHMGGIVGTADDGVIVDHCIGDTDITIQYGNTGNTVAEGAAAPTTQSVEAAMGGIVGFIPSNATDNIYNKNDYCTAGVKISNCINTGTGRIISTDITQGETLRDATKATYYGGILGGVNRLDKIDDDQNTYDYYIENCLNTTAFSFTTIATKNTNLRVGGIVGSSWISAGGEVDTIFVKDCLSVDVTEGSNDTTYVGTNEFTYKDRVNAWNLPQIKGLGVNGIRADGTAVQFPTQKNGATYATRALSDYIYVAKADGSGYELSTTTTFQNVVDALTTEIKNTQALGKTVVAIGHQKGLDGTNNEGAYRIVFGLNKLDYRCVNVTVVKTVEGGSTTFASVSSDVVYTSVKAFTKDGETEVTAESKGVEYLTTLTIKDIPTEGTVTYSVSTSVTNRDTAKTRTAGETVVLKFVNGVLESATVK